MGNRGSQEQEQEDSQGRCCLDSHAAVLYESYLKPLIYSIGTLSKKNHIPPSGSLVASMLPILLSLSFSPSVFPPSHELSCPAGVGFLTIFRLSCSWSTMPTQ